MDHVFLKVILAESRGIVGTTAFLGSLMLGCAQNDVLPFLAGIELKLVSDNTHDLDIIELLFHVVESGQTHFTIDNNLLQSFDKSTGLDHCCHLVDQRIGDVRINEGDLVGHTLGHCEVIRELRLELALVEIDVLHPVGSVK